jgi:membrane-associated phospholipid phosphatase
LLEDFLQLLIPLPLSCKPDIQKPNYMAYKKTMMGFALIFIFSSNCIAQNFDINLLKPINGHQSNFKDDYFKFTSNSVACINIAAPLGIFTAGLIKHDKKLQRDAAFMVGGFIVSTIVTHGLKIIVQRDRPFATYPYIIKKSGGGGYSFPSGHTSAAFCSATSLSLLFPKWYVIAPAYLWAASVGYGRMYQGVHYPTDILAGAIVGAGSAWLAFKAEKWYSKKYNKNKQPATAFAL